MTPTETIAEMIRYAPHACALAAAIGECREDRRAYNAAVARVGALDSPHATSEERVERFATQAMAHAYAVDRGVSGAQVCLDHCVGVVRRELGAQRAVCA
jgi:hypothetical protein